MIATALDRSLNNLYDVTVEHRGRDVLDRIGRGERFDVIVCDMMMPEMTGIQLHDVLSTAAPDQASAMVKPFSLPTLIEIIDQCLAEGE
jgi:CheY-like chemotaxis protein